MDWARRTSGYVIEDDYDSEFRYDWEPGRRAAGTGAGPASSLHGHGQQGAGARGAPRLGARPRRWPRAVAEEKEMSDRGSCTLDQLALATLLTSGRYDRHLRRMRSVYAAPAGRAGRRVRPARARGHGSTGLAAGFQAVAPLPAGADEAAVTAAARERRVGLYGVDEYRGGPDPAAPALVMGFGNVRERAVEPAVAAVADLLR